MPTLVWKTHRSSTVSEACWPHLPAPWQPTSFLVRTWVRPWKLWCSELSVRVRGLSWELTALSGDISYLNELSLVCKASLEVLRALTLAGFSQSLPALPARWSHLGVVVGGDWHCRSTEEHKVAQPRGLMQALVLVYRQPLGNMTWPMKCTVWTVIWMKGDEQVTEQWVGLANISVHHDMMDNEL